MKVTQLCLTLCNPMDYTVHGILQARILEWVAFPFSRGSFQARDQIQVSCTAGRFFTSPNLHYPSHQMSHYLYNIFNSLKQSCSFMLFVFPIECKMFISAENVLIFLMLNSQCLEQGSANFFCKGSGSICFKLCRT